MSMLLCYYDVVMSRCSHCKHNDITSLCRNVISVSYTYFTATNRISLWSGLIQYRFLSRLINGSQLIRRLKMHTVNRFVMDAEVGDVQYWAFYFDSFFRKVYIISMIFGILLLNSPTKANCARRISQMANFAVSIDIIWVFVTHYVFTEMLRDCPHYEVSRERYKNWKTERGWQGGSYFIWLTKPIN